MAAKNNSKRLAFLEKKISEIAKQAGIAACSTSEHVRYQQIQKILLITTDCGYDILGLPINDGSTAEKFDPLGTST